MSIKAVVAQVTIPGYAQKIVLRCYRHAARAGLRPVVLYFHGGRFNHGSLDDAERQATAIALATGAWVVSVGYSLAPEFPFPAALEDGYLALQWVYRNAAKYGADRSRIGIAGHDAGGGIATGVAAMARDRREIKLSAQALIAPLLDPSLTNLAAMDAAPPAERLDLCAYADCYRAYLPNPMQRLHPYAAPLDSLRLAGLPPVFIASAANDALYLEADKYAAVLTAAGVPIEVRRFARADRDTVADDPHVLADVSAFLKLRLAAAPL
jgi:acetyl esterase/lipase